MGHSPQPFKNGRMLALIILLGIPTVLAERWGWRGALRLLDRLWDKSEAIDFLAVCDKESGADRQIAGSST